MRPKQEVQSRLGEVLVQVEALLFRGTDVNFEDSEKVMESIILDVRKARDLIASEWSDWRSK